MESWNPFFFFMPSIIPPVDLSRKSPISTAEGVHFFSKTAPGAEPFSS